MADKPLTEYGLLMSGGGFHVRNTSDRTEDIYPVAEWAVAEIRTGAQVYRRKIVTVEIWTQITLKEALQLRSSSA
jgi:hypothetical protein